MTFPSQANLQVAKQNASAVQLLASLKANVGLSSTNDSLFEGLLAQAADQKSAAPQASAVQTPIVRTSDTQGDSSSAVKAQETGAADTVSSKATEHRKTSAKKTQKAERKDDTKADDDSKVSTDEAKQTASDTDDSAPVQASAEEGALTAPASEQKDEAQTDVDETLKEWLAALCPLDEKQTDVKSANAEKSVTSAEKAVATGVQNLAQTTTQQAVSGEETMASVEAENTGRSGKVRKTRAMIEGALQTKADHRQTQTATNGAAQTNTTETATDALKDDVLGAAIGQTEEVAQTTSPLSAQKAQTSSPTASASTQQSNSLDTSLSSMPVVGLVSSSAAPQKAAAASSNASDVAKVGAAGSSATSQTTALPTGEGVRASAGYDFASQLSALRGAKTTAATATNVIEQVAVQINKMAKDGQDEIVINLKPADLGKIEIKLEIHADKTVHGTVIADNAQTLSLLSKDSSSLQRALLDAGLQADSGSLSFSLKGENQNAFAQNQQQNAGRGMTFATISESTDDVPASSLVSANDEDSLLAGRVNLRI